MQLFTILAVAASLAISCKPALAATKNYTLPAFTGVSLQLPLSGQVNLTSSKSYTASLNAVDQLVNAASLNVSKDGILVITVANQTTINAQYTTPQTVAITVPSGALSSLALSSSGSLTADPATLNSNANFSASLSGQGYLVVQNATVNGVTATTEGQGTLELSGNLGAASYSGSGQGSAYLDGNVTSVYANLQGQGVLYISSTASPTITGTASGQVSVTYTQGTCTIVNACTQQKSVTLPGLVSPSSSGTLAISGGSGGTGNK